MKADNIFSNFMKLLAQGSGAFGITPETEETMRLQKVLNLQEQYEKYSYDVGGMKAAGLNPALMYSSGSANIGGISTAAGQSNNGLIQSLLSMVTTLAANRNEVNAQKEIAKLNNQTSLTLQSRDQQFQSDYMRTNVEFNELKNAYQEIQNRILESTSPDLIAKVKSDRQLSQEEVKNAQALRANLRQQFRLFSEQIRNENKRYDIMCADYALRNAQTWQIYRLTPALEEVNFASANYTANLNESETIKQAGYKLDNAMRKLENTMKEIDLKVTTWRWTSNDKQAKMYRVTANGFGQVMSGVTGGLLGTAGVMGAAGKMFGGSRSVAPTVSAYGQYGGYSPYE